jgi:hypothetical protein
MANLQLGWRSCRDNIIIVSRKDGQPFRNVRLSDVRKFVNNTSASTGNITLGNVLTDPNAPGGSWYIYTIKNVGESVNTLKVCSLSGGQFINRNSARDLHEYQLVVPRYAVVNEYIHDDASIQDGRWLHANTLSPPDGDTQGQAIGVWLFQSSPRILSIIAREKLSQDRNDILVGYQIILDRTLEEREEGDAGETAKEGDAEVIVEEVEVKKEVEVERDAESGEEEVRVEEEVEIEVKESIMSRPVGDKHERVCWVGPVRLVADTGRSIDGVDGSAAFLLTNFDEENLFHLLVPRMDEVSLASRIEHYTQEKSILGQWTHVATLQPPSDVPGTKITVVTFVQSSQGKFEAVARVTPPNEGDNYLAGYELDAVNNQKDWSPPFRLVADTAPIGVTGSPTIIESDFGEEDRFHLLVPNKAVTVHYTQAVGSFSKGQWKRFATLNPFQNLPVTAVSLVENQVGGFEAVTRVQRPQGDELVIGYELKPGTTQWSDGVALNADDGPILAGKPTPPVDELPTNPIG